MAVVSIEKKRFETNSFGVLAAAYSNNDIYNDIYH